MLKAKYIFILNCLLPLRSEQVNGAIANEIKHVQKAKEALSKY